MDRFWIFCGGLTGFGAVALAALASHALPQRLSPHELEMAHSVVQMAGWHALALVFCGLWAKRRGGLAHCAAAAFFAGLLLFCGGVGAIIGGFAGLGHIAPFGGVLLMGGWLLLALSAIRA